MAKSKFIMHYCAYCHRDTKMEFVGKHPSDNNDADVVKSWYRCTKCKHSALLKLSLTNQSPKVNAIIERKDCTEYSKDKIFTVGEPIYYPEWDDVGKVIRKDKMSNGTNSIVVAFEKLGERKLLENVIIDSDESMQNKSV